MTHNKQQKNVKTTKDTAEPISQDVEVLDELEEVMLDDELEEEAQEQETVTKEPDWKDAYIRLAADFDNFRKRNNEEFDAARKRERERVLDAWLDVYDATERALANLPEKEGPWFDGFQTLLKQMNQALASFGIKPMDCLGQPFNPQYHDALAVLPNPDAEDNTIIHIEKRGFLYQNGEVMRAASVVVAKNS